MSFISNLFHAKNAGRKDSEKGSVEEFVTLIRVYYQSVMAGNLGITNMNMLPDMALFKRMLKIPTKNNKLGIAEKSVVKKTLQADYHLDDSFFKEMDHSVKKVCRHQNDVQTYFALFQGFSQDLFNLMGSLMQWKFRFAMLFKKLMRSMTEKTVHDILTKSEWKEVADQKSSWNVRKYAERLNYSEAWITDFVYIIVLLAREDSKREAKERKKK